MNEIIIDCTSGQTRVGVLENSDLVEVYIEKSQGESLVGSIYKARVCDILPGMQAAFLDIGYQKNAFLYVDDVINGSIPTSNLQPPTSRIEKILKPGQEILVQVIKEPIASKGPRVTTHITLPGRHLVLLPNTDYIGISRRIEDQPQRDRLKEMAEKIKPDNMGLIVRTVSQDDGQREFAADVDFLMALWQKIKQRERYDIAPCCVYNGNDMVYKTVRDLFAIDTDALVVNEMEVYNRVKEAVSMIAADLLPKVVYRETNDSLFSLYRLDNQIEKALSKQVWLKSGGRIVIEQTEALTTIDVNTGKYIGTSDLEQTILKTNIEAAGEIAKQLRLRDIGGIIIIDFIDMGSLDNQNAVLDALKDALKKDRTKTLVVGITKLGLVEMTRKKSRKGISANLEIDCPMCKGTGKVRC